MWRISGLRRRPVALDPELFERQVDHAALHVVRVDVDHRQDHVGIVRRALGVREQLVVLGRVEPQPAVGLERGILLPDSVDDRDQLAQAVGTVAIPFPRLVLLRVQVFLRTLFAGAVFHELESRAVDPVAGAQGGGEDEARLESRPASGLQVLGEDVRRVGPQVRPEELADRRLRQLGEVLVQLVRRVPPSEVGVGLAEARLGEAVHHLRPRESL